MKCETKFTVKSTEITNIYAGSWQNGLELTLNDGDTIISIELNQTQMQMMRDGIDRRIDYLEKQKLEQAQELVEKQVTED